MLGELGTDGGESFGARRAHDDHPVLRRHPGAVSVQDVGVERAAIRHGLQLKVVGARIARESQGNAPFAGEGKGFEAVFAHVGRHGDRIKA